MKKRHLVIKSHKPSFEYHLELTKGDLLNFERKPTDVAGWIWCTTMGGKSCWIPESWVKMKGKQCEIIQDYSSKELAAEVGEIIELKFIESGWAWIKNGKKEFGWIPIDCIT
jgi:hypothetical protein